ncbi:MAG TPA: gamma-glutamyltransferase [Blastocatellia bacterium]|nr:gamma-glutamyltransferase [Blastocatellia bacterium]
MKRLAHVMLVIMVITMMSPSVYEQDRSQARSMVISVGGVVAAEHPLAAQAGAMILARGGHAVDAAIAANAVMGVVAPMSNGIGGDLFAIVYEARTGKLHGLNASGWAPARMTLDWLKEKGHRSMPQRGIDAVTVPGTVDGWHKLLSRFGRLTMAEVLAPAIYYAEEGFPVTEQVAVLWAANERILQRDPAARRTFLPSGRAPRVGEVFRNPDLAWSYRQIATHGRDAFYRGEIARRILAASERLGGAFAPDDLAEFSSEWVEPIWTTYRGWTVYELPPNGQGIAALEMLNIMENFPLSEWGHNSVAALHYMIEAKKLAYADMIRFVADPKFHKIPVAGLLSKEYARERAKMISPDKANCHVAAGEPPAEGQDTVYLSVVDREGNMVSLIQSNYENFGSGIVAEGTGFALQNRGALFSFDPSHPNVVAGRKRPLHTIIPAFMMKGDIRIAFGIMGGFNQAQAHAQFVSNIVDHGMNIQMALEAPRFTKRTFEGCDVQMEARIPASVRQELASKGHEIEVRGDYSPQMGGGQAVMRNASTGVNYGASDPRKDGAAIAEPWIPAELKDRRLPGEGRSGNGLR